MRSIRRLFLRVLGVGRPTSPVEVGHRTHERAQRGLWQPGSLPGTVTLAGVMNAPQKPVQPVCMTVAPHAD